MNANGAQDSKQFQFLLNEYSFLADYLKYNYDERDKYIQFYVGALTAVAAVVGFAIKNSYWEVVLIMTFLNTPLSYFVLLKVLFQRVVVTEYKNHLNLTRGKLLEFSGGNQVIKSILLPTDACVKFLKTTGGDAAIMRILGIIMAFSAGTALFVIVWRYIGLNQTDKRLGILVGAITFIFIIIFSERRWQRVLREKDEIWEKKNREPAALHNKRVE